MTKKSIVRATRLAGVISALVLLILLWLNLETLICERLPGKCDHYARKLSNRLAEEGVLAYWNFDDLPVYDLVSGAPAQEVQGVEVVSGRYGTGRELLFDKQGTIKTTREWTELGKSYTLSLWLRVPHRGRNFHILRYLEVRSDTLFFHVPSHRHPMQSALPDSGDFFHVTGVVDSDRGLAELYINGVLQDSRSVSEINHRRGPVIMGETHWNPPPECSIDELTLWGHALPSNEVAQLAQADESLLSAIDSSDLRKLKLTEGILSGLRSLSLIMDQFNPFQHADRLRRADLSVFNLILSKDDMRAFNAFHNRRIRNGIISWETSTKRRAAVSIDGESVDARIEILGSPLVTTPHRQRKVYSIEVRDLGGVTTKRYLLVPAEHHDVLLTLLASELAASCRSPAPRVQLCVLQINNALQGLYLYQDNTQPQVPFHWAAVFGGLADLPKHLPFFREEVLARFDRLADQYGSYLQCDHRNGLSRRETKCDIRRQREQLEAYMSNTTVRTDQKAVEKVLNFVRETYLSNGNPSPDYLLTDVDLSPRKINGVDISFESQSPSWLSDGGQVTKPEQQPVSVDVTAKVRCGDIEKEKTLSFRIMPRDTKLPAMMVTVWDHIEEEKRVPCEIIYIDPAHAGHSERIVARASLRGNSALTAHKKYFSLKTYDDHDIAGFRGERYLQMTSAYRDATFMREKLTYDLFRSFASPGNPRYAPRCRYVNLFFNQTYHGLYTISDRVDDTMLGLDRPGDRQAVLYKAIGGRAEFDEPKLNQYIQKFPHWRTGEYWEPLVKLIHSISDTDCATFGQSIEHKLDIDNMIDFQILLNLVNSKGGVNHNLFLARGPKPEDRFFFVPWDYDEAYYGDGWLANRLTERLESCLPGYPERLASRWTALRRDQLSEESIMARMAAMEEQIAGSLDLNFERWPLEEGRSRMQAVNELKTWIRQRLRAMDDWIKSKGPAASLYNFQMPQRMIDPGNMQSLYKLTVIDHLQKPGDGNPFVLDVFRFIL